MSLINKIASILDLPPNKVKNTIELLKNDYSVPFIARYRKEITDNLDEEAIRQINVELQRLESLDKRRQTVLHSIESQGKLTGNLKRQILQADTITYLEDLYLPYRPKRRTKATIAKEKGLEPLAKKIIEQTVDNREIESHTEPYIDDSVPDYDSAIAGASDIVAEVISENAFVRQRIREKALMNGKLISEKVQNANDNRKVYDLYYQFEIPIKLLKPHQILAINRGEKEGVLRVSISIDTRDWLSPIRSKFPTDHRSVFFDILKAAVKDGAKRLLLPSIERDIRRTLIETAESHAIKIFAENLKALLSQPPLFGYVVLAIDPGFRTGSKIVVVDATGKLLDSATIYPHPPQNDLSGANRLVESMIKKHKVSLIVIGNGTASRETELFIAEITKNRPAISYLITNEAGASVYSASKIARKEFPKLDVSIRGAVSIARRVQDPLAELVKIDPKSIGVGLYQHDLNQTALSEALDQVVESVVNSVGVDLNTASAALLTHVAGIGPGLAEKIVQYREETGPFKNREELFDVPGMGPKSFEQSAGFLRIRDSENPLDVTAIHPESYPIALKLYELINITTDTASKQRIEAVNQFKEHTDLNKLAKTLNTGLATIKDILSEIARPGRDPRDELPKPLLRKDILKMDDLVPGLQLKGTIRNVVDFGAFVDIGVKTEGLLHRSKIKKGRNLKVGEIINVGILSIDHDRNRIALDMKELNNDN